MKLRELVNILNKLDKQGVGDARLFMESEEQYGSIDEVEVVFTPEGTDNEIYLK